MEKLTKEQEKILRHKGTEVPFTGKFLHNKEKGTYVCAACGNALFDSKTKFDSETGWPSFWDVKNAKSVKLKQDYPHGLKRIEVVCKKCGGHLGHVFNDGPQPTGQRYCINSLSLDFKKRRKKKAK